MKSKILPLVFTIFIVLIIYYVSQSVDPAQIKSLVQKAGFFGPLVVILLTVIAAIFAPLSATPISFVGFILYGPFVVFLLTIAALISAIINFYISRKWGRPLVKRFVGEENILSIDKFTSEYGVLGLFLMRVFLGGFHDFVSYAMGLTNMRFSLYYLVTILGIIPGALLQYFVAINSNTPVAFLVISYLVATVFVGVYLIFRLVFKLTSQYTR